MSVSGTYGVGGLSGVEGIWDVGSSARKTTNSGKGGSGDTVSISDKARELLREKLGRFADGFLMLKAERLIATERGRPVLDGVLKALLT